MQEPDVFAYDDYRAYLRAFYAHRKQLGRSFSLRVFSRQAGLTSSNYLKLVMDGDRNLSAAMAARFAGACGLRESAAAYFCELVALGQSKTHDEREHAYARLKRFRAFRKVHPLDGAHEAYYAHWYIPAIRELAAHPDFRADPRWVASMLLPSITTRQANKALGVLRELGLLIEDETRGLRQAHALVTTPDRPLGHHVKRFHRVMMERATEALELVPREQREVASLTLCLSSAQLGDLKDELVRFRKDVLQRYAAGQDAVRVVQLNLQLFPLSIERE